MTEPDRKWNFETLLESGITAISSYALVSKPSLDERGFMFGLPMPIRVDVVTRTEWWDSERRLKKSAEKRRFIGFAILLRNGAQLLEAEAQKLLAKAEKLRALAAKFDHCEEIRQLEARRK